MSRYVSSPSRPRLTCVGRRRSVSGTRQNIHFSPRAASGRPRGGVNAAHRWLEPYCKVPSPSDGAERCPETGICASDSSAGHNGIFHVLGPCGRVLRTVSGNGFGWEHVSVSLEKHCPNWQEMYFVKDLFWDEEETVIQFHAPKSEYVNNAPNCLHLWRPLNIPFPMPPADMVGVKGLSHDDITHMSPAERLSLIQQATVTALQTHESKPASPA